MRSNRSSYPIALAALCFLATTPALALVISTWNLLAPCHKNIQCLMEEDGNKREAEDASLWKPRAEALVDIISTQLLASDVICLQVP